MITSIGGQALIEGIMMRGPKQTSVSVRLPDGTIETSVQATRMLKDRYPVLRLPILRGVAGLVDSLSTGYRALNDSAGKAGADEGEPSRFDRWMERVFGDKLTNAAVVVGGVLGVALAVALFFLLPTWAFNLVQRAVGPALAPWRAVCEGVLRAAIFVGYMLLCSLLPDMRRLFQYHGAEHKTIFCYENEQALTVENVRKHRRFHPRCGTSFFILMILLGIIVGFFIPFENPFLRTAAKLLCIPLVVGVGYELIRLCGRYDNLATRIIAAPGMWMQRITTKEPDDGMIEVAIEALQAVIPENGEDRVG